jgi:hypothetical protein
MPLSITVNIQSANDQSDNCVDSVESLERFLFMSANDLQSLIRTPRSTSVSFSLSLIMRAGSKCPPGCNAYTKCI